MTVRDGGGYKRRSPISSRESGMEANVEPSREIIPGEVIHITLQNAYWIIGITWMLVQMWDHFHNKMK